jgi:hypothetical protein
MKNKVVCVINEEVVSKIETASFLFSTYMLIIGIKE